MAFIIQRRRVWQDVSGGDMGCLSSVLVPGGFVAARRADTREGRAAAEMQGYSGDAARFCLSLPELHDLGTAISISDF